MKLKLIIDGIYHEIDTTNPDMLGKWIVEIFGRIRRITPATLIQFQAYPSFVPDADDSWKPDWIADSRIIGQVVQVSSPRELVEALSRQIDEWEALTNGNG